MSEGKMQGATVPRSTLVVAVLISVILTAVIVGSIVFAWQNAEVTEGDLFRQELLDTETDSLQEQLELVTEGAE